MNSEIVMLHDWLHTLTIRMLEWERPKYNEGRSINTECTQPPKSCGKVKTSNASLSVSVACSYSPHSLRMHASMNRTNSSIVRGLMSVRH